MYRLLPGRPYKQLDPTHLKCCRTTSSSPGGGFLRCASTAQRSVDRRSSELYLCLRQYSRTCDTNKAVHGSTRWYTAAQPHAAQQTQAERVRRSGCQWVRYKYAVRPEAMQQQRGVNA